MDSTTHHLPLARVFAQMPIDSYSLSLSSLSNAFSLALSLFCYFTSFLSIWKSMALIFNYCICIRFGFNSIKEHFLLLFFLHHIFMLVFGFAITGMIHGKDKHFVFLSCLLPFFWGDFFFSYTSHILSTYFLTK